MELYLIAGYAAVCIAVFALLRIPLNRRTVPAASIGGIVMVFLLVQLLNFYHPYSGTSRHILDPAQFTPGADRRESGAASSAGEGRKLVAWFHQNSLLRLNDGSPAEVTFESIPGKVFAGRVQMVLPTRGDDRPRNPSAAAAPDSGSQPQIPVLIQITDPRYAKYEPQIPDGSPAGAAVYGEQLPELALVRKTLIRMSAWMNYLSVFS